MCRVFLGRTECMKCGLLRPTIPGVSVCQSVTRLRCAKTAERIQVLLRMETLGDPRNIILDGSPDFSHGFNAAIANLLWPLVDYVYTCRYIRIVCPITLRSQTQTSDFIN